MVTGCDSTGTFISDMTRFLDAAKSYNILVTLTLWNGAVMSNSQYIDMVRDTTKTQSYIDNCLKVTIIYRCFKIVVDLITLKFMILIVFPKSFKCLERS